MSTRLAKFTNAIVAMFLMVMAFPTFAEKSGAPPEERKSPADPINFPDPRVAFAESETDSPVAAKLSSPAGGLDSGFISVSFSEKDNPGKMSGAIFNSDRNALLESNPGVYNWIVNSLGETRECLSWVKSTCASEFNVVSTQPVQRSTGLAGFIVLQRSYSHWDDRRVVFVLTAGGEMRSAKVVKDDVITLKESELNL